MAKNTATTRTDNADGSVSFGNDVREGTPPLHSPVRPVRPARASATRRRIAN